MPQGTTKVGRFSYGDYCRWPDDERWELIDGEACAIAPAPSRLHQEFTVELTRQIAPSSTTPPDWTRSVCTVSSGP
ncbi:Uma2 family endonuclease [Thiobaca trueperi]|uniref:Putative restriction endonuclease n=1 Tax=Thiobaca trueperi TaxID=127458 RepID=A0A4R3N717_9GAMM|nr:Uma2 family endonuclease [Thiobaca trueperi]TCT24297.1 putative restriction endonuclease [Thiobaca trueperi]